jgi:ATP-dependent Clp endopeptidase proteolytic subunit ClpP
VETSEKQYKNPEGDVTLRVNFEDNKVRIEDEQKHEIAISDAQCRWLATELDSHFGGGPQNLDADRVVFFTGEVDEKAVQDCQKEMLKIAYKEFKKLEKDRGYITLFINSQGGSCVDGTALIDTIEMIRGMGIVVVGVVMGIAYSMGSGILQACSLRMVAKHGRMMLHQVSSAAWGKLDDMEHRFKETLEWNRRISEIYAERNTKGHGDVKFWERFLKGKDKYLSGQECVDLGIVDGTYRPLEGFKFPMELSADRKDKKAADKKAEEAKTDGETGAEAPKTKPARARAPKPA